MKSEAMEDGQSSIFLPEEVVTEILLRLHITPLFKFKCTSKQWNSIISDPKFGQRYLQRATSSPKPSSSRHLWGMLDPLEKYSSKDSSKSPTLLHETDHALYAPKYKSGAGTRFKILASSNGLVLSQLSKVVYHYDPYDRQMKSKFDLYVSNPLTKQFARLPLFCSPPSHTAIGFATRSAQRGGDNPAYVTYKVVLILTMKPYSSRITLMTFSSGFKRWTRKELRCSPGEVLCCTSAKTFTYKGILHWFDWDARSIVTYDPYDNPNRFGRILLPNGSDTILRNSGMNLIHLGHEELLKYGEIEDCGDLCWRLCVWRLVDRAKGEWHLEQKCLINPGQRDSLLNGCRSLVAPDPWNAEFFCYANNEKRVEAIDLGSSEDGFVDPIESTPSWPVYMDQLIPIGLCPWSSPFYGRAKRYSLSDVGFRKMSHVWYPCFSKH